MLGRLRITGQQRRSLLPTIHRLRLGFSSETLSETVTQGVTEENKPNPPGKPKPVPDATHPNRNMEIPSTVPNEKTEEWIPKQVPDQPGGGKYPDPGTDGATLGPLDSEYNKRI